MTRARTAAMAGIALAIVASTTHATSAEASAPSDYLAGYTSDRAGDGSIKRLVLPTATCTNEDPEGVVLGISDGRVFGEWALITGAQVSCTGGVVSYAIFALAGEDYEEAVASAGDTLSMTVDWSAGDRVTVSTTNETSGQTVSAQSEITPFGLHFGALPAILGSETAPAPDFGEVAVVKARVDGKALRKRSTTRYDRFDDGALAISTSRLRGGSFDLSYENSDLGGRP